MDVKTEEPIKRVILEKDLITTDFYNVSIWDIGSQQVKEKIETKMCKSVKKDPHNENILGYTDGKKFMINDLRTKNVKVSCEMPQTLLSLDFNPIKVHTLATAGEDSTIRFWDLRKLNTGLCLHSYNPTDTLTSFQSLPNDFCEQKFSDSRASMSGIHSNLMQKYQTHWINSIKYN